MTIDDLISKSNELSNIWNSLNLYKNLDSIQSEIKRLKNKSNQPNFWDNNKLAQETLIELSHLENKHKDILYIEENLKFYSEILNSNYSEIEVKDLSLEILSLEKKIISLWQTELFKEDNDKNNAIIFIQAGAGGVDAQDFVEMLFNMYKKFVDSRNFSIDVIEYIKGQEAGLKKITFFVKGLYAYGIMKQERGVHRLVRNSPFNASNKRQTSFVMVQVLPEIPEIDDKDIEINSKDLKIDVFRSSGAGGQSVNTTDSAVRITHLPTNIVISIQTERSQLQNKSLAITILKSKLWEKSQEKLLQEKANFKETVSISWGNHIRSYVLNPYKLVKDSRSNYETTDVDKILNGDLEDVINSVLITQNKY